MNLPSMKFMLAAAATTTCVPYVSPVKNYPTLKFMLPAVAATTVVPCASCPMKTSLLPENLLLLLCVRC